MLNIFFQDNEAIQFIPQISNSEIFPAYSSFKIFLPRFQLIR